MITPASPSPTWLHCGPSLAQQGNKLTLGECLHTLLPGSVQFLSRPLSDHKVVRLVADGRGCPSPQRCDPLPGFTACKMVQCAGKYERLTAQRLLCRCAKLQHLQPYLEERVNRPLMALIREKVVDGLGHFRADAGNLLKLLSTGIPDSLEATEVVSEVAGYSRPHFRNAQGVEEALELDAFAVLDSLDELPRRVLGEAFQPQQVLHCQHKQIRHVPHHTTIHQGRHGLRAQVVDVQTLRRDEMLDPPLELRSAASLVGAQRVGTALYHLGAAGR